MSRSTASGDMKHYAKPSCYCRVISVFALLFLSPVITNLHFGAIRITNIFALIFSATAWGCGSLLIRELVRRRGQGWSTVFILGVALAITEECVFLQTSFYPLIGVDPNQVYGRLYGVNWPYLLWSLGYESVWAVAIPILLVECLFPACRNEPWLGKAGLGVLSVIFVVAGVFRWYGWTRVFIPQAFPASAQGPSALHVISAIAVIVATSVMAIKIQKLRVREHITHVAPPSLWGLSIVSLACSLVWFILLFLAYGAVWSLPAAIPMAAGILFAPAVIALFFRWATSPSWRDIHTLSLAFGALLASMTAGFLVLKGSNAPTVDYVGKIVVNVLILSFVLWLGKRSQETPQYPRGKTGLSIASF